MTVNSEPKAPRLGDPAQWVDRYGDTLLRFALSRVGQREIAEELVQETFLAAWQARESYDGRSAFGTWLCSILRRKAADHFRRQGRRLSDAVDDSQESEVIFSGRGKWLDVVAPWKESPEQLAQRAEFWAVFIDCLDRLPGHLAAAFQLRELRQTNIEEICAASGITPKNLSVRLHRARLLLRRCLDQKWFRSGV